MKLIFQTKLLQSALLLLSFSMHMVSGCNFGFGNLGLFNFGFGNVGFGNKGFLNLGALNTGFANIAAIRNIGALNVLPIPNTIGVFNVPVYPNLTPPVGKRRRRSTLKYDHFKKPFPWSSLSAYQKNKVAFVVS